MKKLLAALLAGIMMTAFIAGCGQQAAAPQQKEITVYTALEDDQIPKYLESFKKKYPNIKVNIVRDSTGVITAKLLAEKDNPQADLVWGTAATSLLLLDQKGMLEPYAPQGADRVLSQFKDSGAVPKWVGIDAWMTAFAVNKEEMNKRNLPMPNLMKICSILFTEG